MTVHNAEIAEILNEIADLLEIQDANPFRVRAYRNAGQLIATYSRSLEKMLEDDQDLTQLPGIGADLAGKIAVIIRTGELPALKRLEKQIPKTVLVMLKIPGLGPKRVKILYKKLKIKNLDDLEKAAQNHHIRELKGFGPKTETAILTTLENRVDNPPRYLYTIVQAIGEELLAYLKKCPAVSKVVIAGSYRRKKDTIGDLDFLITAKSKKTVMDYFLKFNKIAAILARGKTKSTIQLHSGLQVDLRVIKESSYGAALLYFTGSKSHNIAIRRNAIIRKLKINEYGVFKNSRRIAGKTEKEVYRSIGLPYIEPELRENRGEITAAANKKLPKLVVLSDIRGDLHCHTQATDGLNTLEQMAQAAILLNYEYIAITDHTQRLAMVGGQNPKAVQAQIDSIDRLNEKLNKTRQKILILKSAEVDILENGDLDLPDKILKKLDLTVCSIHSKFNLSAVKQTERIMRAMDNRYFTILGHPTGRLLNKREPLSLNFETLFPAGKERNCFFEVNAQPNRLDLSDELCKLAKETGVKMVISTDAHSADQLKFMQYGVNQARRGWLERSDIINTHSLEILLKLLKDRR